MRKYEDIRKEQISAKEQVESETKKDFQNILSILDEQERLLSEVIFNMDKWKYDVKDNNVFYLAINSLVAVINSIDKIKKLILEGDYTNAINSLRPLLETLLYLENLTDNPLSWPDWLNYQKLNIKTLEDTSVWDNEKFKKLRNKFSILSLIKKKKDTHIRENSWYLYGYFSLFSHPSFERIKQFTEVTPEKQFRVLLS